MKFVKSDFAKKLIIILVAIIVFNAICPQMTYAWDILGVLGQPLYWLLLGIYIPIDITFGSILTLDFRNDSDGFMDKMASDEASVWENLEDGWSKLFVGPDTIFRRRYQIF